MKTCKDEKRDQEEDDSKDGGDEEYDGDDQNSKWTIGEYTERSLN